MKCGEMCVWHVLVVRRIQNNEFMNKLQPVSTAQITAIHWLLVVRALLEEGGGERLRQQIGWLQSQSACSC